MEVGVRIALFSNDIWRSEAGADERREHDVAAHTLPVACR